MKKLIILLLTIFALNSCEEDTTIIDATVNKKMEKVKVCHYDAETESWKTISVSGNALKAHLKHGDKEGSCDDLYTYVPDDAFELWLIHKGYDELPLDDYVLTSKIESIRGLNFMDGVYIDNKFVGYIKDITGIRDFRSLEDLVLDTNLLTEVDVSGLKYLEWLDLSFNQITKLNVHGTKSLRVLVCIGNKLTELDVSGLGSLKDLDASDNLLHKVDFNGATSLDLISLSTNKLTEIDVSSATNLYGLSLFNNQLTKIKANTGKTLNYIYAGNNPDLTCIEVFEGTSPAFTDMPSYIFNKDCGY